MEQDDTNAVAQLTSPLIIRVRLGRDIFDVTLTAVKNVDRGLQRYVYIDGYYMVESQKHTCKDIPLTDVLKAYHTRVVAIASAQEELDRRGLDMVEELYGTTVTLKINTRLEPIWASLQVRLQPTAGFFAYKINDNNLVEVRHGGVIPFPIAHGTTLHMGVQGEDEEIGQATIVFNCQRRAMPIGGMSVAFPLTLYLYIDGELFNEKSARRIRTL